MSCGCYNPCCFSCYPCGCTPTITSIVTTTSTTTTTTIFPGVTYCDGVYTCDCITYTGEDYACFDILNSDNLCSVLVNVFNQTTIKDLYFICCNSYDNQFPVVIKASGIPPFPIFYPNSYAEVDSATGVTYYWIAATEQDVIDILGGLGNTSSHVLNWSAFTLNEDNVASGKTFADALASCSAASVLDNPGIDDFTLCPEPDLAPGYTTTTTSTTSTTTSTTSTTTTTTSTTTTTTSTTTTTTVCVRPTVEKTYTLGYAVTTCTAAPPNDTNCTTVDFTSTLTTACEAFQNLPSTTLNSPYTQIETITVQATAVLDIGVTFYLGTGTDCTLAPDGWYWFLDHSPILPEESVSEFLDYGSITIVHVLNGIVDSISTCELEAFTIQARSLNSVKMDYLLCYTNPITVVWGDGTYNTYQPYNGSPATYSSPTHTYTTPYTGDIIVITQDLTNVITFSILDTVSPSIPALPIPTNSASNFYLTMSGYDYSLLDGLGFSSFGNCYLDCTTADLPRTLKNFGCRYANVSGDVADLPPTLQNLTLTNYTTITGPISDFPKTLRSIQIGGDNTIDGDLADIPVINTGIGNTTGITNFAILGNNNIEGSLASLSGIVPNLIGFNVQGNNTIIGDIANLPCSQLITCAITGNNEVSGDISGFSGNTVLAVLEFLGLNTVSGNLSSLTGCTALKKILIDGASDNPLTGTTITGNISSLPTGLDQFVLGGNNTVTGTLSAFASRTLLTYIVVNGLNTLSGDIKDIPPLVNYLSIEGSNTINAYSVTKTWPSTMYNFRVSSTNVLGRLSTADIDRLIIDLNGPSGTRAWSTYLPPTTPGAKLVARGTYTNSGAVLAAYNGLVNKIVTGLSPYGIVDIV
jgi:hypothetical protein